MEWVRSNPPSSALLSMCKPLHARPPQRCYCMSTAREVVTTPCGMTAVLVPVRRFPRLEPVRCGADQGARHVEDIETYEESFMLQRSFTKPFATAPSVVQRASLHIRRDPSLINFIHKHTTPSPFPLHRIKQSPRPRRRVYHLQRPRRGSCGGSYRKRSE